MNTLFMYALTNGIQSFVPVLMWVILPVIFGDNVYAEGFMITYPYQFIYSILYSFLFISQLKYEKKENAGSRNSYTGMVLLFLIETILFVVSVVNYKSVSGVLGLDDSQFTVFCFSLWNLVLDWSFFGISAKKQYEGKDKQALVYSFTWHLSKLLFICILSLFFESSICLMATGVVYGLVLVLWFLHMYGVSKLGFSLRALKFCISPVSSDLGMTLTYILGISNLSGVGYLAEYNMMSLCTDTQWDVLSSGIDTNTTLSITDGRYSKKLFSMHIIYSLILVVSSFVLLFCVSLIPVYHESLNFKYVFISFIMEMSWFPFYAIVYTMNGWVTLMSPTMLQAVLNFSKYVLRICLTLIVISDYAVSWAMCGTALFGNTFGVVLYLYVRRRYSNECRVA